MQQDFTMQKIDSAKFANTINQGLWVSENMMATSEENMGAFSALNLLTIRTATDY